MNLQYLRYALEVEKTGSISKAAENLLMSQPNLSRAIKELEESLGITIFKRTSKGVSATYQGEEFLSHAKRILSQVDEVEAMYKNRKANKQRFLISVPRASYIACAFINFINKIDINQDTEIYYKETNSLRAINNILQADYKLGIIRYQTSFEQYFNSMLYEHGLASREILSFNSVLLLSKEDPLARKDKIEPSDLRGYIELAYPDPYVPSLPLTDARKAEHSKCVEKRIYIFERASKFDLLKNIKNSFMWVSPMPQELLDLHQLVQKPCKFNKKIYKDVLIYRKDYYLSDLDQAFIDEIDKMKEKIK
ncbi:MAG TPA: LysR family transcriptional regulator [Defluviitaleaceae bacterium]|nr:LysR family transcriptional regulator [Defluviitaleaceae bacterium]HPT75957.1 LysR family transcriptional regulator [Defluviitaleaceae bacterium]HQD49694.1 LysR family transcriptional regulator [Defluviitaleaceae bacterium]